MSRVYTAQDSLKVILNGGESDVESSDDEEITELAKDEEEVPEDNIDDFSSGDDEPLSTFRTDCRPTSEKMARLYRLMLHSFPIQWNPHLAK